MNRRELLAAAPAALVAGALPAIAGDAETPISKMFREWVRLDLEEERTYENEPTGEGDALCDAATARKCDLARRIQNTPAQSLADLGMIIMAMSDFGNYGVRMNETEQFRKEARALVA
ncbi:hypothetical protein [Celeribacter sp. SCSIO 80788]|uniref:hypothetical protein n=1 Tax=Celeribacter sp. SCSIO 80788 TaxID=3117013 RepID=UPI003DA3F53C